MIKSDSNSGSFLLRAYIIVIFVVYVMYFRAKMRRSNSARSIEMSGTLQEHRGVNESNTGNVSQTMGKPHRVGMLTFILKWMRSKLPNKI